MSLRLSHQNSSFKFDVGTSFVNVLSHGRLFSTFIKRPGGRRLSTPQRELRPLLHLQQRVNCSSHQTPAFISRPAFSLFFSCRRTAPEEHLRCAKLPNISRLPGNRNMLFSVSHSRARPTLPFLPVQLFSPERLYLSETKNVRMMNVCP